MSSRPRKTRNVIVAAIALGTSAWFPNPPTIASALAVAACYDWTVVPKAGVKEKCRSTAECETGLFCSFADHLCGKKSDGICLTPLTDCKVAETVCTCSGTVAKTRCEAESRGDDVSIEASCELAKTYRCGYEMCPLSTYCVETAKGSDADYRCEALSCATPSCKECTTEYGAFCAKPQCEAVTSGGVIVHCQ